MTSIAMPATALPPQRGLDALLWAPATPFTQWLERWRYLFFFGLILLLLVPFNGQWRMGLDSSIYRGVAESLATGHGYTFAGRPQTQIYPGLPFLLAFLQKLFATKSVVPALIVMNALSIATIFIVYGLLRMRYPMWVAVVVACGVGMNARFVQQAQEVMTDTPFLFGCVTAMFGWERLSLVISRRGIVTSTLILIGGLFIAATMRPTFWVLAAAWGLSAVWNLAWRRERRSLIALGALLFVFALLVAVDPRFHGLNLLQGGYEKQFIQSLSSIGERVKSNAPALFTHELCEAFFGEPMAMFAIPFSIALLVGAALVTWRQPAWGLQVFILTGIMLMQSDVPRYYLMVLPTLWLGYILLLLAVTRWLSLLQRDGVLFVFFSLSNFMNGAAALSLVREQHAGNFLATYKHGTYLTDVQMADKLNKLMQPDEIAIGPRGQLLSFLSHRNVLNAKVLGFETQGVTKQPGILAAANAKYLVGPASLYKIKDPWIFRLLMHGVIVPGKLVERVEPVDKSEPMWISLVTINVPVTDWRALPTTRPRPIAAQPVRHGLPPEEVERRARKARLQLKQARAERAARNARKLRRLRQQQTTQPSKPPATMPAGLLFPPDNDASNGFVSHFVLSGSLYSVGVDSIAWMQ